MKRYCYIGAFTVLGFLVSMVIHALVEIPTLVIIAENYDVYGSSFIWRHWWFFHGVLGKVLSIVGAMLGFFLGRKCWQVLYVEKRYGTPRW